jgi:hypothetical protein
VPAILCPPSCSNNFTSQNPTEQIFGLGTATVADTVVVEWPSGIEETFQNVPSGVSLFQEN